MQQVVLLPSLRIIYKIIFKYVAGFVDQSVIFLKVSLICWVCYTFVNRGRAETCPTPATDHEDHKNCDWSAWSACYFLFSSFLRPVEVVEGEDVMKAVGKKWLNNLFLFSDTSCKRHLHREPSAHHDHHSLFLDKTTERRWLTRRVSRSPSLTTQSESETVDPVNKIKDAFCSCMIHLFGVAVVQQVKSSVELQIKTYTVSIHARTDWLTPCVNQNSQLT